MAMTLQQGSVLPNGNSSINNRVPLAAKAAATDDNKNSTTNNEALLVNEASNGAHSVHSVHSEEQEEVTPPEEPSIEIIINNVVCSFSVKSHLNLKQVAQNGFNVEYRRENGVCTKAWQ